METLSSENKTGVIYILLYCLVATFLKNGETDECNLNNIFFNLVFQILSLQHAVKIKQINKDILHPLSFVLHLQNLVCNVWTPRGESEGGDRGEG